MTLQLSRRGKQYLQTAQTLLRNAQSMTDSAVAFQLRTLAEEYQRRAEKASQDDAAKAIEYSMKVYALNPASPRFRRWSTSSPHRARRTRR